MALRRKAQTLGIGSLVGVGVLVVIVGLIYSFGSEITGDVRDDIGDTTCAARTDGYTNYNETSKLCSNTSAQVLPQSAEFNATVSAMGGIAVIPNKLGTIMLIVAAAIIIGILVVNLGGLGIGDDDGL